MLNLRCNQIPLLTGGKEVYLKMHWFCITWNHIPIFNMLTAGNVLIKLVLFVPFLWKCIRKEKRREKWEINTPLGIIRRLVFYSSYISEFIWNKYFVGWNLHCLREGKWVCDAHQVLGTPLSTAPCRVHPASSLLPQPSLGPLIS